MSRTPTAVLFDVDGTLVDSNHLHAVCWWEAFTQAGHDVPMARIHRAIGMGSGQMLDALLPSGRDTGADAGLKAAHGALYATYWSRQRPLPGATDLLRACKKRGLTVVLASSADVRACGEAGVRCIGLLSGGISRAELLDAGAAEVYDGPAGLVGALSRSILTRG